MRHRQAAVFCCLILLLVPVSSARGGGVTGGVTGTWHEVVPPNHQPLAGAVNAMAWDSARSVLVLHQGPGFGQQRRTSSTWSWDGKRWDLDSLDGPPAWDRFGLVYDARRQQTVLFGGLGSDDGFEPRPVGETWEWNGRRWRQRIIDGPSARSQPAMAYHAARGVVLLHGGDQGTSETWTYDGDDWVLVGTAGPAVDAAAMAYDASRHRVVMVGGGTALSTWVWDGAWAQVTGPHPPTRTDHALAYDENADVVILTGGHDARGRALKDVWEFDGAAWSRAGSISSRGRHAMAYESSTGRVVVFGGTTDRSVSALRDTLVRKGRRWVDAVARRDRQPPPAMQHVMVYDAARSETVLYDAGKRTTWIWNGARWELRKAGNGPSFRTEPTMAYDPRRGRAVLFGGAGDENRPQLLGDTWEWNGRRWKKRSDSGPLPAYSVAMGYDPNQRAIVLFGGGTDGNVVELSQFWKWGGRRWREVVTSTVPEQRAEASMAVSPATGRLIMTGGYSEPLDKTPDMQTWEFTGGDWQLLVSGDPGNRASHALVQDPAQGRLLLFGGFETQTNAYSPRDDLWTWDGQSWTQLVRGAGEPWPFPDPRPVMVYDEARDEFVMFGRSVRNGTWVYRRD